MCIRPRVYIVFWLYAALPLGPLGLGTYISSQYVHGCRQVRSLHASVSPRPAGRVPRRGGTVRGVRCAAGGWIGSALLGAIWCTDRSWGATACVRLVDCAVRLPLSTSVCSCFDACIPSIGEHVDSIPIRPQTDGHTISLTTSPYKHHTNITI